MYFSYNGTRDWLKIEWRDQSCMKLGIVAKRQQSMLLIDEEGGCESEFL